MANWLLGYTLLIVAIAFTGYIANILRERKTAWVLTRVQLVRCHKCKHVYMIERHPQNPHCPHCNTRTTNYILEK